MKTPDYYKVDMAKLTQEDLDFNDQTHTVPVVVLVSMIIGLVLGLIIS